AVIAAVGVGTLAAGIVGLVKTGGQGAFETPQQAQRRENANPQSVVGMGGLVSPIDLSKSLNVAGFLAPLEGKTGQGMANQEIAVLNQMKTQLAADSAKFGTSSAQAHADQSALVSTANKWGSASSTALSLVDTSVKSAFLQLLGLNAKQDKLNTTGSGNLEQSKFIKAVLDNQLNNAKTTLAKDETAKASKQAIDQARQKVQDAKTSVDQVQNHIDQLKSVANEITKTKDTLASQQALSSDLSKLNADTSSIKSSFSSGLTISKLPSTSTKATGSVKVNF